MPAVNSSAIAEVDYESSKQELPITFHSTETHTYFGVPATVHEAFIRASSLGTFFNDHIRDRYSVSR